MPGNGKINFMVKTIYKPICEILERKILRKLRVFPFILNKDVMIIKKNSLCGIPKKVGHLQKNIRLMLMKGYWSLMLGIILINNPNYNNNKKVIIKIFSPKVNSVLRYTGRLRSPNLLLQMGGTVMHPLSTYLPRKSL